MEIKYLVVVLIITGQLLVFTQGQTESFIISRDQFALDLYKNIHVNRNVIVSSLSIDIMMNVLLLGASGNTYKLLKDGMRYPSNYSLELIEKNLQAWQKKLKLIENVKIATKLYINHTNVLRRSFLTSIKKSLSAEAEKIIFAKSKNAANTINKWIEKNTRNLIRNVIESYMIDYRTFLVGVNCIYFSSLWTGTRKFDERNSFKGEFFKEDGNITTVKFMTKNIYNIKYDVNMDILNGAKAISIPYEDESQSMMLILPPEKVSLLSWINSLQNIDWMAVENSMNQTKVNVTIPKFDFSYSIELVDVFKKMGMSDVFTKPSDFSKIFATGSKIGFWSILHKSVISVNENGTVAAAVTVAGALALPPLSPENEFYANRPFFFLIRSGINNLFMGQYMG